MADASAADGGAGSLNLTPEEKRVFGQLFRQADSEGIGVVTGEVAVKFFEKTRLEPTVLGEIWQIADKENRGLLTPAGFGIVLRLIGHYQAGREPTPELAFRPGPLPKFEGLEPLQMPLPPPGPPPGAMQPQLSGGQIRVPPLTSEKVNQYSALFEKSGAQDGILPGEQAKQIFEKAGLPNDILGRIWSLADTEQRGVLVLPEFIIAMHLIASFRSGSLRVLPTILPAGLYEAATRRVPTRQMSGAMPGPQLPSAIPRQFSGTSAGRANSPLARPAYVTSSPASQATVQIDWAVNPVDKAQFDGIYATVDKTNRGFITGDEAVPFFSNSKLPEEVLAQIWDLADIKSQGRLSRDEFAVAMYLIRQQRNKVDGRGVLPSSLPPNLVPPSLRNYVRPPAQATASVFEPTPQPMPTSAADDLFGLDALSTPPPASTQAPASTGGSTSFGEPFGSARTPMTPSSPTHTGSPLQPSTSFKPFVPSSSFGQSIAHSNSGSSSTAAPVIQSRSTPPVIPDLLGDSDPEVSRKLTTETTELANLSNQVGTLSTQMKEVQGQRATSQNELTQAATQKKEFELRLSQLRGMYEQEVKDVKSLQERLTTSRSETKKLQQDIAMIEGTYQDLQNQHRHILAAFQADQQENTSLKERMRLINADIAQMKPQLEKLRSEARQQKGLVAINKKQLSTNEGERDKFKAEVEDLTKINEEQSRALATVPQPQSPAPVVSPALSTMSANNPFFRRQASISSDGGASSPFVRSPVQAQQTDRSFENVFGPEFAPASIIHETAMLPSTFNQEIDAPQEAVSPAAKAVLPERSPDRNETTSPPLSQQSLHSREISSTSEPPPPPESRQISSSFLPFPPDRANSLSSSRQVSAPTSRYGESSTTGADTPTSNSGTTPTGPPSGGQIEGLVGVSSVLDRNTTASPATSEARSVTNLQDSMPGAFPGEAVLHNSVHYAGGNALTESKTGSSSNDAFSLHKEQPRTPTTAKDEFDAAFAGFGGPGARKDRQAASDPSSEAQPTISGGVNKEFPPLQELEHDDEDSDTSDDHGGFEDDFTSVSPGHSRKESGPRDQFSISPAAGPTEGASSSFALQPSTSQAAPALASGTQAPAATTQPAPPVYDNIISPREKARAEIDQYSGLLPTRQDPTSSSQTEEQATNHKSVTGGQALFGSLPKSTATEPSLPSKTSFDEFDHDFDDLEDAKEGDVDDDFANISAHDRSGAIDFDPTFDSPAASKTSHYTGPGSSGFGSDSNGFGDFAQSPTASQSAPGLAPGSTTDSHDWDAIFAGLDAPSTARKDVSTSAANKDVVSASSTKTNGAASPTLARPQFGRALTEAGEHDDPILKDLTAMGYSRKDALSALEKYDYNLERAANYLASQS